MSNDSRPASISKLSPAPESTPTMKRPLLLLPLALVTALAALAAGAAANETPHARHGGWAWDGTAFAADFYRAIALEHRDGNLVTSPFAAAATFAMLATGARGETARTLGDALRFLWLPPCRADAGAADGGAAETEPPSPEDFARPFRNQLAKLAEGPGRTEGISLETTASLWIAPAFAPRAAFVRSAQENFAATVRSVEMDESGRETINAFVSEATHGLVPSLFDEPFGRDTVMALAGTVCLKAAWEEAFDPGRSFDGPFHAPGGVRTARFMTRESVPCEIARLDGFSALLLPYADGALHLLVLLPDEGADFREFEGMLSAQRLGETVAALKKTKATVVLPRFSFASQGIDLLRPLHALGAGLEPFQADFSGIADGGLAVGRAVQTARIAVDEEGAEAAAATGITMLRGIAQVFRADRPFLFAIVRFDFPDRIHLPLFLFLGRVVQP